MSGRLLHYDDVKYAYISAAYVHIYIDQKIYI